MSLVATYTTLDDVRRILRSTSPRGRIRFSESYAILRSNQDNTGTVELSHISIHQGYSDVANHKIVFQSDSTTFKMYRNDSEKQNYFLMGTGIKQADFTTNDGFFLIEASKWSGYTFPGDEIEFMTDSHMNYFDATRFIQDAEHFVDTVLERNIRFATITEDSLRFPEDSTSGIPKSVRLATMNMAAYMIYKSIYFENMNEDAQESVNSMWLKSALSHLSDYVEKFNLSRSTSAPVVGNLGTNLPMDMEDDIVFKGSVFNLYIPMDAFYYGNSDYHTRLKAYNMVTSTKFTQSMISDIADLSIDGDDDY